MSNVISTRFHLSKIEVVFRKGMSEKLLEELFEKRDYYLYVLKHLEFKSFDDDDPEETKKLMDATIKELQNIENEIKNQLNYNPK